MSVRLKMSRVLLEQMLCLGDRRIVGVGFEHTGFPIELHEVLVFEIEAPDAPKGAVEMDPVFQRQPDGTLTMLDPGWILS